MSPPRNVLAGSVLAVTAIIAVASTAAADGPPGTPYGSINSAYAPKHYNWTGLYVGANAGYGWTDGADRIQGLSGNGPGFVSGGSIASTLPAEPAGFIGGAQVGYNWQIARNWIAGVEADVTWTSLDSTVSVPGPTDATRIMTANQSLDWLGTVRARIGALPSDRLLVYLTGGFAFGDGTLSTALTRLSPPTGGCAGGANNCQKGSASDTLNGWTIGGGLEYAVANNWTLKAEYLFVDLGSISHLMTDPFFPATVLKAEAQFDVHIVRAGFNYKF